MSELERAVEAARRIVRPSRRQQEFLDKLSTSVLSKTKAASQRYPEVKAAVLGGSYAKGTWLPDHADLDVFLEIEVGTPESRFEEVGLAVGSSALKGFPKGKKFAQHPYTEAKVDGVKVNVVPCYAVKKGEWKSAADRSPFHTRVVSELPPLKKEQVRLLKLFMVSAGVYGAEIEVQGFSGYAAEVLVMKEGDFVSVLRWFAGLTPGKDVKLFSLADPVDPGRDLSTAISKEKLGRMILASRAFLADPSLAYFVKRKVKLRPVEKEVLAIVFKHPAMSEDTLWGELRKSLSHLVSHLESKDFRISRSVAASDGSSNSAFLLLPLTKTLPSLEMRSGPEVFRGKDLEAFLKTNRTRSEMFWVDQSARVQMLTKRKFTKIESLLLASVRARKGSFGASPEVAAGLRRSARIIEGSRLEKEISKAPWLGEGVAEIASDTVGTGAS